MYVIHTSSLCVMHILRCIFSQCAWAMQQLFLLPPLLQDRLPLAVVGSNTIIEVNGKRVRGRQYPWGVAEGEGSKVPSADRWPYIDPLYGVSLSLSLLNTNGNAPIFPLLCWVIERTSCVDGLQSGNTIHVHTQECSIEHILPKKHLFTLAYELNFN